MSVAAKERGARRVYLDWNATTPPLEGVIEAVRAAELDIWANPASVHRDGQRARAELDRTRRAVARLLGREAKDVILTGGGTEANNLAVRSSTGPVVTSRLEHPSITRVVEALEREGREVRWVQPEAAGRLSPDAVAEALAGVGAGALLCVQAVNHETGVIQPIGELAEAARRHGASLHCDAVQAAGRLEVSHWDDADSVSVAAHKIRGPKGIGALVTRPRYRVSPVLRGGDQERGIRPGTQSAALAAGFRVAAEYGLDGATRYRALATLRDRLESELGRLGEMAGVRVATNGEGARGPHVTNLSFEHWKSSELCAALDLEGLATSSGSACSAGTSTRSPVIESMLGRERAESALRLSLGDATTALDIEDAIAAFARVLNVRAALEST